MPLTKYLPAGFLETYGVHNYRHATEVLAMGCPDKFAELVSALKEFRMTTAGIPDMSRLNFLPFDFTRYGTAAG